MKLNFSYTAKENIYSASNTYSQIMTITSKVFLLSLTYNAKKKNENFEHNNDFINLTLR